MDDKEEKKSELRLVIDNSQGPIRLADHMEDASRRVEIMSLLSQFLQAARAGDFDAVVIIAKKKGGEALYGVAPLSYRRFELLGMLNAMVHIETNRLTIQRPIEEPKDPSGA